MQQIESTRLQPKGAVRDPRLGADVLDYISHCRQKFERELEKLMGGSVGLIQQMKIAECQAYFPRLSLLSQCYAMPAVNIMTAMATQQRIHEMEHLFSPDPMQYERAKRRIFESDRTIFTIENPLNPKRLARIDAVFAGDIQFDDPHSHGSVHKFIEQIRNAPCERSKAYLAGAAQVTATVRIAHRTENFDLWMLGLLREQA